MGETTKKISPGLMESDTLCNFCASRNDYSMKRESDEGMTLHHAESGRLPGVPVVAGHARSRRRGIELQSSGNNKERKQHHGTH